jgi:hypothetical protein
MACLMLSKRSPSLQSLASRSARHLNKAARTVLMHWHGRWLKDMLSTLTSKLTSPPVNLAGRRSRIMWIRHRRRKAEKRRERSYYVRRCKFFHPSLRWLIRVNICAANVLPPPHSLSLPIVKLLTDPSYLTYQSHIASLSLYSHIYLKFVPSSWGEPTPEATSKDLSKEAKEWKRRIKMYRAFLSFITLFLLASAEITLCVNSWSCSGSIRIPTYHLWNLSFSRLKRRI